MRTTNTISSRKRDGMCEWSLPAHFPSPELENLEKIARSWIGRDTFESRTEGMGGMNRVDGMD